MKIVNRRQGSKIVQGQKYSIFQCDNCNTLVPVEEEVLCWHCGGLGEMLWIGYIIMKPHSLPEQEVNMGWLSDFIKTVSLMELLQMNKDAKNINDSELLKLIQKELRDRDEKK